MRLAQRDILDYVSGTDYEEKKWPDYFWPKAKTPSNVKMLDASIAQFHKDLQEALQYVMESKELTRPLPNNKEGHTLLRELLLIADHNAYHTGQIILMRRLLRSWTPTNHH